jgi:hypothetical protein
MIQQLLSSIAVGPCIVARGNPSGVPAGCLTAGLLPLLLLPVAACSVACGIRPEFPPGTPPQYKALAEACWAQEAEQRPAASVVVQQLQVRWGCLLLPPVLSGVAACLLCVQLCV